MTPTEFQAILQADIDATLAHKQARADAYLSMTAGGTNSTKAWQLIAVDDRLAALERAALEARADRFAAMFEARFGSAGEEAA